MDINDSLISLFKSINNKPGWEVKEYTNVTFLKSPINNPKLNLAIINDKFKQELIENYFANSSFGILEKNSAKQKLSVPLIASVEILEMQLNIEKVLNKPSEKVKFLKKNNDNLKEWC